MAASEWLLIDEAAAYAGCSTKTLRRAVQNGTLKGYKRAQRWRFMAADIDAWLRGETVVLTRRIASRLNQNPSGFLTNVYREMKEDSP